MCRMLSVCTLRTYSRSLGSGESNVTSLASGSSWTGWSSATILSSRTLDGESRKWKKKSHYQVKLLMTLRTI